MGSVCAEQHHKFHSSHQLNLSKKSLREIDIPPRKLLGRRGMVAAAAAEVEDAAFSKFLPCNSVEEEDDSDPYSSDHFRMFEFKVRKCNRSRSHDWTDCPFAHPGEKARRRDPRRFHYSGNVCSDFRKGHCGKGDNCESAHGVFECWLHPSRYRTEACKDGKNCKRKVCFFAHSTRQLRILPENPPSPPLNSPNREKRYQNLNNCCVFCHSVNPSPTSTLIHASRASPPMSPPISPMCSPEFSLYGDRFGSPGGITYKEAMNELMASFDSMNVNAAAPNNLPWLDVNFNFEDQPQFVLSPAPISPPTTLRRGNLFSIDDGGRYHGGENGNLSGPDLGWVNDLLT
ncbi:hypothetical protein M569_07268 [Genlisea aurea]|uniref:C3H1-type domain-containing protein n=1 Tax=Genlisea aurea TaxID=192259 RepID=S8E576_9LAMI|nr:hypothetical protein M569_07268 [Genlisea aurea]